MIGLYGLCVAVLWLWLTWLLLRFGWRVVVREKGKSPSRNVLVGIVILAWLGASFWYGGGRKYYYDWRVERMCAVDGGIRIYAKVVLPAEKFNQWGQIDFFRPNKGEDALGPEYVFRSETKYILKEKYGQIEMLRHHDLVYLRSNNKLLGEQISYARRGGDIPGPWHPSSYACPDFHGDSLIRQMFVKP